MTNPTTLKNLGSIEYGKRTIHYSNNITKEGTPYTNITIANKLDYSPAICLVCVKGELSGYRLKSLSPKLINFILANIPSSN